MTTRDRILSAFQQKAGHKVSGGKLGLDLGISRAAIWKQIKSLQALGIPIEGDARQGYRFKETPDLSLFNLTLSTAALRWVTPHYEMSTASTQTVAKEAAQAGRSEGHLWIAEIQSAGRGRLDRIWDSGFGGLWMSLLLRPSLPPARIPAITLVAAIALAETVQEVTSLRPRLKWPNDLVVSVPGGWKKIAGILTEMSGEMDRTDWVAMGIGLNVNNNLPDSLAKGATSLKELTGTLWPRADVLEKFLARFRPYYLDFQRNGFKNFREHYWKLYMNPKGTVHLQTSRGKIAGSARGVDGAGALLIESRGRISPIFEGEIIL